MRRYLLITCLFVLCYEKLKHVNFLKWEQEKDFYYINNEKLLKRVLNNVEQVNVKQTKEITKVDKPIGFVIRKEKFVTLDKETKEEKILKDNLVEAILVDPKKDEELKVDIKETNIDEDSKKKKQKKENEIIKDDTSKDKDLYSFPKDPITLHKKKLKEEKNFVMIKEFVKDLSSRDENVLISNVNIFLKRIFNLILREKIITAMCSDVQNEGIQNNDTQKKGTQNNDTQNNDTQNDNTQNYDGKDNNSECLKNNKNCNFDNKIKIKDCNKGSISCFLSNIKNEEFYKAPDLFKYYISLERMLRSSSIRSKTDRISKYFTFYPISIDKEYYEEKINNHAFLEAVRNILFDLHEGNKKDKKKVFSSFVIVVDTLISLIKQEKVVKEMYIFIHLFFQDLNLLNKKILDILLKSSFKPGTSYNIPDFNKKNFEFILSRIYTRYVLNNLLNRTFNNSDTIHMSDFLNNKIKPFNFSFTETSVNLLKNESIQIRDDDLLVSEENLCKYIPIKKKLLYEKLNKTRKAAEEAILDYIFKLLLRKLHEFITE
ncbi:hypothetical protein PRSY57_0402400 [Plasmodium reichenowi]|uniref:Uncharacterized protein n=1 Tax=Plasmodium reichenowi TaxID=5854 RepID=A0A151LS71_PLARE|nr:hypothetical protein PRSY57_0402400 [Plasmodium reichenowi]KYO02031.1 hypothetical protein PRSY57_0402400 [Plasmodium reichenowi]